MASVCGSSQSRFLESSHCPLSQGPDQPSIVTSPGTDFPILVLMLFFHLRLYELAAQCDLPAGKCHPSHIASAWSRMPLTSQSSKAHPSTTGPSTHSGSELPSPEKTLVPGRTPPRFPTSKQCAQHHSVVKRHEQPLRVPFCLASHLILTTTQ